MRHLPVHPSAGEDMHWTVQHATKSIPGPTEALASTFSLLRAFMHLPFAMQYKVQLAEVSQHEDIYLCSFIHLVPDHLQKLPRCILVLK